MKFYKLFTSVVVGVALSVSLTNVKEEGLSRANDEQVVVLADKPILADGKRLEEQKKIEMMNEMGEGLVEQQKEKVARESVINFDPDDIATSSNLTTEKITKILAGTNLVGAANAYYWAEKTYGVNALFLIAVTAEESHWGNSEIAHSLNNINGSRARDSSGNYHYIHYSDFGECIDSFAKLVKEEYITPGGAYYTGANIYDINRVYCPAPGNKWASNVIKIARQLQEKARD